MKALVENVSDSDALKCLIYPVCEDTFHNYVLKY